MKSSKKKNIEKGLIEELGCVKELRCIKNCFSQRQQS